MTRVSLEHAADSVVTGDYVVLRDPTTGEHFELDGKLLASLAQRAPSFGAGVTSLGGTVRIDSAPTPTEDGRHDCANVSRSL